MTSFIDQLIEKHNDIYIKSISHPLTNEICQGTLLNYKLYTYLNQDLKFFDYSLNVLGKTLALCNLKSSSIRLSKQIGWLAIDENDYFINTLKELESLDLPEISNLKRDQKILPQVSNYINYLKYLIKDCSSYLELITFCYVMEKVYLGWVKYNETNESIAPDLPPKFQIWIDLHNGKQFIEWVEFLKNEIERIVTESNQDECEKIFIKSVNLEIEFFNACYDYYE
ncbi:uncharacterized protein KGF55_005441 [Candida pseudojiufengensis]|uniref:uncharacterized protein n=1 Tax=Candida pseudojiufengensis TaxID=497109 RepID=UPI002225979D|nr:uncharacterized protein KGF55_005441 [Candida pseudojiufengensis]KAI5959291.1 hypothetical protein KGF55_005441 [Candida pseudojiufengensis]